MPLLTNTRVLCAVAAGLVVCAVTAVLVIAPWSWRSSLTFYVAPTAIVTTPDQLATQAAIADDRTSSLVVVLRTSSTSQRFARAGASHLAITDLGTHSFTLEISGKSRDGVRAAAVAAPGIVSVLAQQLSTGLGQPQSPTKVVVIDGPTGATRVGGVLDDGLPLALVIAIAALGLLGAGSAAAGSARRRAREARALPTLATLGRSATTSPLGALDGASYPLAVALRGRSFIVVTGEREITAVATTAVAVARGLARGGAPVTLIDATEAATLSTLLEAASGSGLTALLSETAVDLLHCDAIPALALLPRGDTDQDSRERVRWLDRRGRQLIAATTPADGVVVICAPLVGAGGLALAAAADAVILTGDRPAAALAALAAVGVRPMGRVAHERGDIDVAAPESVSVEWSTLRTLRPAGARPGIPVVGPSPVDAHPATGEQHQAEVPDPRLAVESRLRGSRASGALGALRGAAAKRQGQPGTTAGSPRRTQPL